MYTNVYIILVLYTRVYKCIHNIGVVYKCILMYTASYENCYIL